MIWTVVWSTPAQADLADVWLRASDRMAVSRASHNADRILRRTPLDVGDEEAPSERLVVVPPLAIRYQVSPDDCLVTVQEVWLA